MTLLYIMYDIIIICMQIMIQQIYIVIAMFLIQNKFLIIKRDEFWGLVLNYVFVLCCVVLCWTMSMYFYYSSNCFIFLKMFHFLQRYDLLRIFCAAVIYSFHGIKSFVTIRVNDSLTIRSIRRMGLNFK